MSELLCKKALRIDPGGGVVSKFKDLFFLAVCVSSQLTAPNTNGHFLAIFKVHNQQGSTYSTGNSAQCYMAAWMGGEFGGE